MINIASVVGISPEMLNGVYGATKAFVIALTHSLQHELADKGSAHPGGAPRRDRDRPLGERRPALAKAAVLDRDVGGGHGGCGIDGARPGRARDDPEPPERRGSGRSSKRRASRSPNASEIRNPVSVTALRRRSRSAERTGARRLPLSVETGGLNVWRPPRSAAPARCGPRARRSLAAAAREARDTVVNRNRSLL